MCTTSKINTLWRSLSTNNTPKHTNTHTHIYQLKQTHPATTNARKIRKVYPSSSVPAETTRHAGQMRPAGNSWQSLWSEVWVCVCPMGVKVIKLTVRSRTLVNSPIPTHKIRPMKAINTCAQSTYTSIRPQLSALSSAGCGVGHLQCPRGNGFLSSVGGRQTPLRQTNICTWLSPSLPLPTHTHTNS